MSELNRYFGELLLSQQLLTLFNGKNVKTSKERCGGFFFALKRLKSKITLLPIVVLHESAQKPHTIQYT